MFLFFILLAAGLQAAIPATTIPATTIPATTIPATTISATTIPATTPADTISAAIPSRTFPRDTLRTAVVVADRGMVVSRTDTIDISNSLSITEILQQNPALLINDSGGESGLKSVSLRGLGSAHTAIYVDGVRVGNVQSGQTDLGLLGIENFSSAVVDYAQNSVSFNTERPTFTDDAKIKGRLNFTAGSFGTYRPGAGIDFRLSKRTALSLNGAAVFSKGDFPLEDGSRRGNNDITKIKAGADLFGGSSRSDWHVKAYWHTAERGAPGSVSLPSTDRQKDGNAFLQGVYRRDFSIYNLSISAKASYDNIEYTSSWGDSRYGQMEMQLNSSHKFRIREWWDVSLAADAQWDALNSTGYDNARLSTTGSLATAVKFQRFKANAALEYDGARDRSGQHWSCLAPSADIRVTAFRNLNIIAFARRAYRIPCFNELYYVGYGNPDLKPEDATLLDLGVEWHGAPAEGWTLKAKLDGFYNYLINKIISSPSAEDPNIWMPYNVGAVSSAGFDSAIGLSHTEDEWRASIDARYSFQSATDVTSDSYSYGEQIPYVARHTLVLSGNAGWRRWGLNAVWNLRSGRRDSAGEMPDWNTLDATLSFKCANNLTLKLMGWNLTNCRYELSSGYPMPGTSVTGGIDYKF